MHWGHRSGNKSQRLLLEELEQLVLWLGSQWQQSSEEAAASLAQDWELAQSSSSSKLSNKSLTKTIGIVDYSSEQQKKPLPRKTMQKKQSVLISIWRGTAGTFSQQSHAMQLIFQTNFPEELSSKSLSSPPSPRTFQKRFLEEAANTMDSFGIPVCLTELCIHSTEPLPEFLPSSLSLFLKFNVA